MSDQHGAAGWSAQAAVYSSIAAIPDAVSAAGARALFPSEYRHQSPIVFLDIAAGPGTLSYQILKSWAETEAKSEITTPEAGAHGLPERQPALFVVTDFASGMVDAARKKMEGATAEGLVPSNVAFRFQLADAQDLSSIETGSVTHAGCMLSFNLIPNRGAAMREMRTVLTNSGGRAVVGNFKVTATAALAADFAAYIGAIPKDPSTRNPILPPAIASMVTACADPAALEAELKAAGFASVTITEKAFTFQTGDFSGILAMFRSNPAMSLCFKDAPEGTDFEGRWEAFLAPLGPGHAKYVVAGPDGQPQLKLDFVANIAVASV